MPVRRVIIERNDDPVNRFAICYQNGDYISEPIERYPSRRAAKREIRHKVNAVNASKQRYFEHLTGKQP